MGYIVNYNVQKFPQIFSTEVQNSLRYSAGLVLVDYLAELQEEHNAKRQGQTETQILIDNWQDSRLSITPMFHSD